MVDVGLESSLAEVHRVLRLAFSLGTGGTPAVDLPTKPAEVPAALAAAHRHALRFVQSGGDLGHVAATEAALVLSDIAQVRTLWMSRELATRTEMLSKADAALRRLSTVTSTDELVSRLPSTVVDLGYMRALFSWVHGDRWIAHSAHSVHGAEESRILVEAGQQRPLQNVRKLFEGEMLEQRRAIFGQGIKGSARVHPELGRVTGSEAFVAAPLVVDNQVVGFISLDVNLATGTVTPYDRDIISLFCTGAGIALERLRALERMVSWQDEVAQNISALQTTLGKLGSRGPAGLNSEPVGLKPGQPVSETIGELWSTPLTRREEQVLDLLARGLSNAQIGDRLFITEGTAKSHVKNVLRKLGVSNRTEAASVHQHRRRHLR